MNNLEVVIFFYASALVILGFTILAQLRRTEISEFRLLDILWLLAWFGLTHGAHEFIDMFTVIKGENVLATLLSALLSFISFLFLFAFGYRLLNISRKRIGPWLMVIAALGLVMLPIMFGPTSVIIWSISRRYFLAFPASVLIAIGFPLYYVTVVQALGLTRVKRYFFWAGFFFSAYAVIVGLVVAKANFFPASVINENSFFSVVGIPARVFRALVALGVAWSIWKILDIFNIEQERKRESSTIEKETLLHDVGERVKELNCLYTIAKIAAVPDVSLDKLCQKTAEIIPPSWQYPEITCARIMVHDQVYKTANFKKTKWLQAADIIEYGNKAGTVEVYYLEESPVLYEGPFLKEERDLIEGIAERLGGWIERQRTQQLGEALNYINEAMSSTLEFDQIMQTVVEESSKAIGCEKSVTYIREEHTWVPTHVYRFPPELIGTRFPDTAAPFAALTKARKPIITYQATSKDRVQSELMSRYQIESLLSVPLLTKEGALGSLMFAYETAGAEFSKADIDFAEKLAASVALAVENSRLYAEEHKIADTLQETLLTVPEKIEGISFGHLYRSATAEVAKAGGDFFDLFDLEHEKAGVIIGDISGKGLAAATLTSLVKNTLRAYAYQHKSPGEVVALTNNVVEKASAASMFATVCYRPNNLTPSSPSPATILAI